MSSEPTTVQSDLSELIAENFGANATYVETLLARWRSDPSLVDESWRAYFEELVGTNGDAAAAPKAQTEVVANRQPGGDSAAAKPARTQPPKAKQPAPTATQAGAEIIPIRG